MIGALILKMALRSTTKDLNGGRKDKIVSRYAEDAVLTYPGHFSMSGIHRGKGAIKVFFDRYFDQFVEEHCEVRETFIKNIFALGPSNSIAIRFHTRRTNKQGKTLENSGVTVIKVRMGKVVELQDYYSDVDRLQEMWGE
jgi:ketosteroid isomerase-like protein